MRKKTLDSLVVVFGMLSLVSLVLYFLALHDIWHDYASPEVWLRAGQAIPYWYSPVNRCPLEWAMLSLGFLPIAVFHVLFFTRLVRSALSETLHLREKPSTDGTCTNAAGGQE